MYMRQGGDIKLQYPYYYAWQKLDGALEPKRAGKLYGRRCKVVARGKKNSICIEFLDGNREIVSRLALRKIKIFS